MGKLFGTDGVRGIANTELSCELAYKIGQAGAFVLTEATHHKPTILIGKDTRISGDMLEAAMIAGICSVGADVRLLGVIPTPAVAYLTRRYGADAGVVISASHNPMEYNGIKFFDCGGNKLSDELEERIESIIEGKTPLPPLKEGADIGRVSRCTDACEHYVDFLASTVLGDLSGLKIAVDCANGAAAATAGSLFYRLRADAHIFSDAPDGTNINSGCGSTHMGPLSALVGAGGYDVGVAFDGDADRCLFVDENGVLIDGDRIIAALACDMKKNGQLKGNTVVATVMSNMGFFKMARENDISVVSAQVGDRYVLEEMNKGGFVLGGEQSGHIIMLDHNTTGDGQLTALQLLSLMKREGKKASEVAAVMDTYPQVMINVRVSNDQKDCYLTDREIKNAINRAKEALGDDGRLLVRPSGTEALIRVMAEGSRFEDINAIATDIASIIARRCRDGK